MRRIALLPAATITAAATVSGDSTRLSGQVNSLTAACKFDYGSGGTDVTVFIQTSFDGGVTWVDIMAFNFTTADATKISKVSRSIALAAAITPGDGALTDNTILDGLLGPVVRVKYVSTGTYADATTLTVDLVSA